MAIAPYAPFMGSVILTTKTTKYQLSALLAAVDPNLPTRLMYLSIELDLTHGAGNTYVVISGVSSSDCGFHLVPTITRNIAAFGTGLVVTPNVWAVSDSDSQQLNIVLLPIGM